VAFTKKRKFNNKKVEKSMSIKKTALKNTAAAVIGLSSGAVFAGTMGPVCSAVNVTVPCEATAWEFGGKGIYFQPTLGGNDLASQRTYTLPNGETAIRGKNPSYAWGFFLEAGYHFNTGNDLNLNWYHLRKNNSGVFTNYNSTNGATNYVTVDPQWDMVNIEFGQHVDFGENKSIRFHGGAQYARLSADTSLTNGQTTNLTGISTVSNPTYNGFGPRVGADMAYDWGNGISIYANGAASLLAGTSKFNNTVTVGGAVAPLAAGTTSVVGSTTQVVPELDAKLGATYTYALAQGDLTLDAGWMWVNYFQVLQNSVFDASSAAQGNLGLQGPYVGLTWLGNVA
jgi:hypothetical protein